MNSIQLRSFCFLWYISWNHLIVRLSKITPIFLTFGRSPLLSINIISFIAFSASAVYVFPPTSDFLTLICSYTSFFVSYAFMWNRIWTLLENSKSPTLTSPESMFAGSRNRRKKSLMAPMPLLWWTLDDTSTTKTISARSTHSTKKTVNYRIIKVIWQLIYILSFNFLSENQDLKDLNNLHIH